MNNLLSREGLLAAKIATKDVEGVFGGTVRVRALSLRQRLELLDTINANAQAHDAWLADQAKSEGDRIGLARVDLYDQAIASIIYAICDEDNKQVFTIADYDRFVDLDYPDILKLWANFQELATRPSVDEQKKSSGKARTGSSFSGSRSNSARR